MALLIIRLHPTQPTTGAAFASYLTGMRITAFDIAFGNLDGAQIGQAVWDADRNQSDIVQMFRLTPQVQLFPVATAIIPVTTGGPEFRTRDVRLLIERGARVLAQRDLHYNVQLNPSASPPTDPADYETSVPVGIHLAVPPAGVGQLPGDVVVDLPTDGSPPPFAQLLAAVQAVLNQDPGGAVDLTKLTRAQALHIARELVWNRNLEPLPQPARPLEELYTFDPANPPDPMTGSFREADRLRFEGELSSYYAQREAEAEQLSRYVFALSAAMYARQRSMEAQRVGFRFPIHPEQADAGGRIQEAEVILVE